MTTYHTLKGTVNWAKVHRTDKFGNFTIDFYPENAAARKALKDTGIRSKVNEDEDGGLFFKLRRPESKTIRGEEVNFGPPTVIDINGDPFTDNIGNGSEVEVTFSIYDFNHPDHGTGKGHRLEKVRVLNLIPYVRSTEDGTSSNETPVETPTKRVSAVPF